MIERKLAVLTAHKCCGKTTIADKLGNELEIDVIHYDELLKKGLNIDEEGRIDPSQHGLLLERYRERFEDLQSLSAIAEGRWYCCPVHRKLLLDAAFALDDTVWRFLLVEFTLPEDELLERVVSAKLERSGTENITSLPPQCQLGNMRKRIDDWNNEFNPPNEMERARFEDFKRFGRSDSVEKFLQDWFADPEKR